MKPMRKFLALVLAMLMLTAVSTTGRATGGNGVQTPVLFDESQPYDWYSSLAVETERSTGQPNTETHSFALKANVARLTVENEGVTELDIAVNGQRWNLNRFFDNGFGTVALDLSGLITYGTNTLEVTAKGRPGTLARLKVEAPALTARIFHINDIHGKIDTLDEAAAYVKAAKDEGGNVYLINAGDNFSGNPVSDLNHGVPMIQVLNAMTTDALGVGNHDFDHGPAHTQARREESEFPWVTANTEVVDQSATPIQPFEPYVIETTELGQKIAFIGLTEAPPSTGKKNIVGLRFNDPIAEARKYIAQLRDQVNLIVLVSHNGLDFDARMAAEIHGADLIVSAHSHTLLTRPTVVNNIPIVQAGNDARYLGDLVLRQAETVTLTGGAQGGAHVVDLSKLSVSDQATKAIVDYWNDLMDPVLSAKIGYTAVRLDRGGRENMDVSIGNLITDALRDHMGADVGFWNNGGIRDSIPAGDITLKQVYTVLPFSNQVMKVQVTGQQLYNALVGSFNYRNSVDLQTSGLTYTVYTKGDGSVDYIRAQVNGQPLDLTHTYVVALSDYVYAGDRYGFAGAPVLDLASQTDALIVADYIEKLGNLNYPATEGRIQIKASPTPVPVTSLNWYSSSSLLAADDSGALVPLTNQATVLVTAESTAYQSDMANAAPKNFDFVDAGTPIPLAAVQQVGSGKVVGLGAIFISNGYRANDGPWFTNLIDYLVGSTTEGALLIDEGHGQYYNASRMSNIAKFVEERGHSVSFTGKSTPLTAEKLAGVDVLMITTPGGMGAYTAAELEVLRIFVTNGGSVILASQADFGNNSNPVEMNAIAAGIGTAIRFNSDQVTDDTINDGRNFAPITNEFNPDYPELLKAR